MDKQDLSKEIESLTDQDHRVIGTYTDLLNQKGVAVAGEFSRLSTYATPARSRTLKSGPITSLGC